MSNERQGMNDLPPTDFDDRFLVSESVGRVTPPPKRKEKVSGIATPRLERPQSVRNRRNGRDGQRSVARLVGARDIGTLGGVDLDGAWFWGEVKNVHGLPDWFKKGIAQLAGKSDRPCFLFVRNVRQGLQSEVYVIETLTQFLEWNGEGGKPLP